MDDKGNSHDLDYVFEAGGTDETVGAPRAFIEIAWRRYTKHSRNKAQEIQGAILPLAERYHDSLPFLGVVLGGVFTNGSLNQLRAHGFVILHFPYESVVAAFGRVGIDAQFDESTPDVALLRKVRDYQKLKPAQREQIATFLVDGQQADVEAFTAALRVALMRRVCTVYVLPLHGLAQMHNNVVEAIAFIETFDESKPCEPFTRYEVGVRYTNGDEIRGQFNDKAAAIAFLRSMK